MDVMVFAHLLFLAVNIKNRICLLSIFLVFPHNLGVRQTHHIHHIRLPQGF